MSKTYTREEVVELLTELEKHHALVLLDSCSYFPWEKEVCGSEPLTEEATFYKEIYGKIMSLIEATADKDKIKPTKTVARQLLHESRERYFKKIHNNFCAAINEKSKDVCGTVYCKIAKALND